MNLEMVLKRLITSDYLGVESKRESLIYLLSMSQREEIDVSTLIQEVKNF